MSPVAIPTQLAVVCHGPRDLHVEERVVWPPLNNQATVAIASTGLCGSDLHYYLHGRNGDFAIQEPLVLGHEAAGVVTALGPQATGLRVGQRVAIECGIMCGECSYCDEGRYNLCKGMRFCSSAKTFPHLDGTLQDRMNHPAHLLHPLPDNVSFDQAALAEPLSVLIHASRRAQLKAGQTVLVFGVGAIGLLACALARSLKCARVVALDINNQRLEFALRNGFADAVYCLPTTDKAKTTEDLLRRSKENIAQALQTFKEPDGFDVVFECTGAEPCIQMSVHAAIAGGKVMLVGMGSRNIVLPVSAAQTREVDILGSFRYANTYPTALKLLGSNTLPNIEKLITHRFSLKETKAAFELLARGHDDEGRIALKVMVEGSPMPSR
ncbi:GroES-like protein [Schizopora paradoxa]|uniref:GroES-like protein n=1 Tax=Schizopora paradoxa TaxID=27342 RepID=A0A0H2RS82_9AGAM|nr:GroES-like protein [Schizopora paradoxa]